MTIGWALLGPGRHAERNVVAQMRAAKDTRLVAVLSRDAARGAAFAREHGFARAYTTLDALLADREIDALYDATPDGLHAHNIVAAARAGKHLLVEKPLAIKPAEAQRAIDACHSAGLKLGVVYQQRNEAAIIAARDMVRAGAIGEVTMARCFVNLRAHPGAAAPSTSWRTDPALRAGGTLLSLCDHAFDILEYILGEKIIEASAFSNATRLDQPDERVAAILLKFENGALGHADASGKAPYGRGPIEIHATGATLRIHNAFAYLSGDDGEAALRIERIDATGVTVTRFDPSPCFALEIERFNKAICGEAEPMTSAQEGLRAMRITQQVYAAMRDGRTARIAER